MASKKVFVDDSGNELEFGINKNRNLYLSAGEKWDGVSTASNNGYIELDKEDVLELIQELKTISKLM
jgi:hypothetical protein